MCVANVFRCDFYAGYILLYTIAMEQNYVYIGIAVAFLLVLVFLLWPNPPMPSVPVGITINFMGMPVSLSPVNGEDIPCIGAPEGYTRVYYDRQSDMDGNYLTVGYAREGDHLDSALSWIRSKASACGFTLTNETSGAVPGAQGHSLIFDTPDGSKTLSFDVAVVTGSDGKTYTLVRVGLDEYYETGNVPESNESSGESAQGEQGGVNTITGPAAKYDKVFRPIVASVFGSPVIVQQADYIANTYHYDYIVPRIIAEQDTQAVINAFQDANFSLMPENEQGEHVSLGFTRNHEWLQVDYDIAGNIVTIVYVPQQ